MWIGLVCLLSASHAGELTLRAALARSLGDNLDLLQVQRTHGEAEAALVVARASREAAHDRLSRVLGIPLQAGELLHPVDRPSVPEAPADRDAVLTSAQRRNTDWLRMELSVQAAELDLQVARNAVLPRLDVSGSLGLSGGDPSATAARQQIGLASSPSWGVGVDLALPVVMRAERAQLAAASIANGQAQLRRAIADQDLRIAVAAAVRAIDRDRLRWQLAVSTLDAAAQGLAADQELLYDGRGSTRDVVRSLESMQEAQLARLQAEIDLQQSAMQLALVSGTLLDTMAVPDPIQPP